MKRCPWLILFLPVTTFPVSAQDQPPQIAAPSIKLVSVTSITVSSSMLRRTIPPAARDVSPAAFFPVGLLCQRLWTAADYRKTD